MAIEFNHETNDIVNSTGQVKFNGTAVGGDNGQPAMFGSRGVFGGGNGRSNVMDYITIASTGNATDFGDLSAAKDLLGACSSGSRGLFGGGSTGSTINVIDYITVANTGNATDFGD